MKDIVSLYRIEGNIVDKYDLLNPRAGRIYIQPKNKEKVIQILNNVGTYGRIKIEIFESFLDDEKEVFIGFEGNRQKIPSYVYRIVDFELKNSSDYFFEIQSLLFKTSFDKTFAVFRFIRDWKENQGIIAAKSVNMFNEIKKRLLKDNFKIPVQLYRPKSNSYYMIQKILKDINES